MPNLFQSILTGTLTLESYLICTAVALVCGVLAVLVASFRSHPSKSFLLSILLLPAIVETVIFMVNGSVGTGIAVAGAFSLVRFRSVPGKAKEIALLFLAMTAGLACATGFIAIALVFTVVVGVITVLFSLFTVPAEKELELRITVPESLNYSNAFDDLFATYTKKARLISVKTTNMGSLFKLTYRVELKDATRTKELIDDLRCRNGNLEIAIAEAADKGEEL